MYGSTKKFISTILFEIDKYKNDRIETDTVIVEVLISWSPALPRRFPQKRPGVRASFLHLKRKKKKKKKKIRSFNHEKLRSAEDTVTGVVNIICNAINKFKKRLFFCPTKRGTFESQ